MFQGGSEYFRKMFSIPMRESQQEIVELREENERVFKQVLRYIYLGEVEGLGEISKDLLILADKYCMEDLSVICQQHLIDNLRLDNAQEICNLGQRLGRTEMTERAKRFLLWYSG